MTTRQRSGYLQSVFQVDQPVAWVTGSGSPRVGRAIALHLAGLGCRIALHAHHSVQDCQTLADQLQAAGTATVITQGDVSCGDSVDTMLQQINTAFGRIDIVVNSAAIWQPQSLESVSADDLQRYFAVNAVGSFLTARAAGLQMVNQPRGGVIVNIGDWATARPYLDHAAYFPSKGAVETMTRSLAVELASRNPRVRVNCIQPGPVLLAADAGGDLQQQLAAGMLLKRVGTPEHVAHAVQFLCENDFVTGVCLPVDGGRTIYANDGLQSGLNTG